MSNKYAFAFTAFMAAMVTAQLASADVLGLSNNMPVAASQKPADAPEAPAPARESAPINEADYGIGQDEASIPPAAPKKQMVEVTGGGRANDLPAVDASVAAVQPEEPTTPVSSYQEVIVQPGVNVIVPASVGHLNRIVTPFDKPIVQTVSDAQIFTKDNVVYVGTQQESPVTMYITPADDETVAISLTLAPRKVPPIEARLILGQSMGQGGFSGTGGGFRQQYSGTAKKWEQEQPYMDTIRQVMRALALGKLPKGYSMAKMTAMDTVPACLQPGLHFDFSKAQQVMGHSFRGVIAVAQNISEQPILFDETSCTHPTLAATAVWPNNMLEPGQKTEVYVITRVGEPVSEESSRPSLLE